MMAWIRVLPLLVSMVLVAGIAASAAPAAPAAETEASPTRRFDEILDRHIATGDFPSLAAGVVRGDDLVWSGARGVADRASGRQATSRTIYRIASVTKVFTVATLAILRDEGILRLDDPLARWLPEAAALRMDPRGDPTITLRHLATHSSGLPQDPVNLLEAPGDPFNGLNRQRLFAGLAETELRFAPGAGIGYSNLGMALLGHAIEKATGTPWAEVVETKLLEPLGMQDTGSAFDGDQEARLAVGYRADDPTVRAVPWRLGAIAPAGDLASTVEDLAIFVSLQLAAGSSIRTPIRGSTLSELQRPQRVYADWTGGVGLGWLVDRVDGLGDVVRHNGGMGGFRSHVGFSPRHKVGVIVLTNVGWAETSRGVAGLGRELLRAAGDDFAVVPPRLERMARAVAGHLRPSPPETLRSLFSPAFLERIPYARIRAEVAGLAEEHGSVVRIEGMRMVASSRLEVRFALDGGGIVTFELEADEHDPPRLTFLFFDDP